MAFFEHGAAQLFYEDRGQGPPIIATHGLAENHLYWKLPGIADALIDAGYRLINCDMRGHGRSVVSRAPAGFDVETVASDLGALADHLGLDRFHLLTHATGGMAGWRYATRRPDRLLSVMATNTGSATATIEGSPSDADFAARAKTFRERTRQMAAGFRDRTWAQILEGARRGAQQDPFLNRMDHGRDAAAAWRWYDRCSRLGDPNSIADFIEEFYVDPDPRLAALRQIQTPCLVVTAEHDSMFMAPSTEIALTVANAKLVIFEERGHMLALEDPEQLSRELLQFLAQAAR